MWFLLIWVHTGLRRRQVLKGSSLLILLSPPCLQDNLKSGDRYMWSVNRKRSYPSEQRYSIYIIIGAAFIRMPPTEEKTVVAHSCPQSVQILRSMLHVDLEGKFNWRPRGRSKQIARTTRTPFAGQTILLALSLFHVTIPLLLLLSPLVIVQQYWAEIIIVLIW